MIFVSFELVLRAPVDVEVPADDDGGVLPGHVPLPVHLDPEHHPVDPGHAPLVAGDGDGGPGLGPEVVHLDDVDQVDLITVHRLASLDTQPHWHHSSLSSLKCGILESLLFETRPKGT